MSHYLYRLTNAATGEFYVGVRTCKTTPDADKYMGSGRWPRSQAFQGVPLVKQVLASFESREAAQEAEGLLIDLVLLDRLCRNSVKSASDTFKAQHCTYAGSSRELKFKARP